MSQLVMEEADAVSISSAYTAEAAGHALVGGVVFIQIMQAVASAPARSSTEGYIPCSGSQIFTVEGDACLGDIILLRNDPRRGRTCAGWDDQLRKYHVIGAADI